MKIKKIIMPLGTLASVTAPIVTAVSCGTMLSSEDVKGPKVAWDDSSRTIYFNLFNQDINSRKGSLKPFTPLEGDALQSSFPTLNIAQKWEQVAGYSMNKLGKVENLQNSTKIKDGEIVHVVMAAQHFVWKDADNLHSTKWRAPMGYYIKWSFPFHTLENTRLHANNKTDLELLKYYEAYKPWNIQTNFWKALNILLAQKLGNPAAGNKIDVTTSDGATASASAMLSNEAAFKKATEENSTLTKTSLILWNPTIGASADFNKLEAVYQMYHNKEIALTETDVNTIYNQSVS